jgi:lipoyl-dependent peroxiredoxin
MVYWETTCFSFSYELFPPYLPGVTITDTWHPEDSLGSVTRKHRNDEGDKHMPVRSSSAVWQGSLESGNGTVRLGSGAWEGQYNFSSRFQEGTGTNPEELIAAAEASCFTMALSANLTNAGYTVDTLSTEAKAHIEKNDEGGWTISRVAMTTTAALSSIEEADFQKIVADTKATCPVSRALGGTEITVDATLQS